MTVGKAPRSARTKSSRFCLPVFETQQLREPGVIVVLVLAALLVLSALCNVAQLGYILCKSTGFSGPPLRATAIPVTVLPVQTTNTPVVVATNTPLPVVIPPTVAVPPATRPKHPPRMPTPERATPTPEKIPTVLIEFPTSEIETETPIPVIVATTTCTSTSVVEAPVKATATPAYHWAIPSR
jgi:hypothetical protein